MVRLSAAIIASLLLSPAVRAQDLDFERVERGVVKIEHSIYGVPTGVGSGFFVASTGLILTNRHVLQPFFAGMGVSTLTVTTRIGKTYADSQVQFVGCSEIPSLDACLLRVAERPIYVFSLSPHPAKKGQKIFEIGHPLGLEFTLSDGIVSGYQTLDTPLSLFTDAAADKARKVEFVQMTAPTSPGNSGGPVMNEQGLVVGMATMVVSEKLAQNLNFALSAAELSGFLREYGSKPGVPLPKMRLELTEKQKIADDKVYKASVAPVIETADHGGFKASKWHTLPMRAGRESFSLSFPPSFKCARIAGKEMLATAICTHPVLGNVVATLSAKDTPGILVHNGVQIIPAKTLPFVAEFMKTPKWKEVSAHLTAQHLKYLGTVPSQAHCSPPGWTGAEIGKWNVCRFTIYNDPIVGGESLVIEAQSPASAQVLTIVGQALSSHRKSILHGMAEIVLRSYQAAPFQSVDPTLDPMGRMPASVHE